MAPAKRIVCTITSDPAYDQRMIRICTALQKGGYEVTLVGRLRAQSKELPPQPFKQVRLDMRRRDSGKLFYFVYWVKLFWFLLFVPADALCAIDLDTIVPVLWVSKLRRLKRVYDAHELFTEMEEVVSRPATRRMWLWIERHSVPQFHYGYTVSRTYAREFRERYGVKYAIVRNATVLRPLLPEPEERGYILYQGAVNKGRCFEQLIPAMQHVNGHLLIVGEGNFMAEAQALVKELQLDSKVQFTGYIPPTELPRYTRGALVGITLFEARSKSNLYSLANRFFDYMHAGVPQLAGAYPEYTAINEEFEVALLIPEITPAAIAAGLNRLIEDKAYWNRLHEAALRARNVYNWDAEEARLLDVWHQVFAS